MKKQRRPKLTLEKTTIRNLTHAQLSIPGGTAQYTYTTCATDKCASGQPFTCWQC